MSDPPAAQVSALASNGVVTTPTSLQLTDRTISWERYEAIGQTLGMLGVAYCWWVGDLLISGEEIFGEEYAQIEASLPHSAQTLANYRSVAKHVPPERRRASLAFSVHAEVAYLEPKERDAWLDEAERNDWKREHIRAARKFAKESESVGDLAGTGTAVNGGFLGEPVPAPIHTCPNCGHRWSGDENDA